MEKNILQNLSFKQKEQTLKAIFKEYRQAKFHLEHDDFNYKPSHTLMICENDYRIHVTYEQKLLDHIALQNTFRQYVIFIEEAMIHLTYTHRIIIEHEFMKESNPLWWENYFSRSTFYRHKKEAMDSILPMLLL